MSNYISMSTIKNIVTHLPAKLVASAGIATATEALGVHLQLLAIFLVLEVLDVFTRWIALSAELWRDIYPDTPGTVWQYVKFIQQAHKWRYIKSEAMRNQFISKIGTYALILFIAAICDVAMLIAKGPTFLLPIITSVLACTELLSCLENLHEAGVNVASELVTIIRKRKEALK